MASNRPHLLSKKLRSWPWNGIVLGLVTWALLWLFRANPLFAEVVYTQGLYSLLRLLWDYTIGWLPFPVLYVAVPLLIWLAIRAIPRVSLLEGPIGAGQLFKNDGLAGLRYGSFH